MSKRSITLSCSVCGRVFVQGSRKGPRLMCGGCFGEGRGLQVSTTFLLSYSTTFYHPHSASGLVPRPVRRIAEPCG